MEFLPAIRAALGLPETADHPTILAAATAVRSSVTANAQQIASIASAVKLDAGADTDAIITALQTRMAGGTLEETVALQSRIHELEAGKRRGAAEAAIGAAMRDGKPIPLSRREDFITRHMADPDGTDFWLSTMVSLNSGGVPPGPVPQAGSGLDNGDMQIISTLGITSEAFLFAKREKGKLH